MRPGLRASGVLGNRSAPRNRGPWRRGGGIDFHIPMVFYSQLMAVALGLDPETDAALQRNTIRSKMLDEIGEK